MNETFINEIINLILNESIKEFDFMQFNDNSNSNYIIDNNCLLINKDIVKKSYLEARNFLLEYDNLNEYSNKLTIFLLIINPNLHTAWSKRKELLNNDYGLFEKEIKLNNLVLFKHPKCEQAFMHRRWLQRKLALTFESSNFKTFMKNEVEFIYKIAKKVKSNYYCWTYLNWILTEYQDKFNSDDLIKILEENKDVLYTSVSDNCVYHFRLNLLSIILSRNSHILKLVSEEIFLMDDLVFRYPNYETIWNYRKYFLVILEKQRSLNNFGTHILVDTIANNFNFIYINNDLFKTTSLKLERANSVLEREIILTTNFKEIFNSKIPFYQAICNLSNKHLIFLNKFFS